MENIEPANDSRKTGAPGTVDHWLFGAISAGDAALLEAIQRRLFPCMGRVRSPPDQPFELLLGKNADGSGEAIRIRVRDGAEAVRTLINRYGGDEDTDYDVVDYEPEPEREPAGGNGSAEADAAACGEGRSDADDNTGTNTEPPPDPIIEEAVVIESVDPVDLWGTLEPPRLPMGVLPAVIENFARAMARSQGSDIAGSAMAGLVVAAATITDDIRLRVQVFSDGWIEEARLWVMIVGGVSSRKTPMLKSARKPLEEIDRSLLREYQRRMEEWKALSKEEQKGQDKPVCKRVIINDTTQEGAQNAQVDNPEGLLVFADELSGWHNGMERYHGGKPLDRPYWLQCYDGGPYHVDRVTRGHIFIENCGASVLGGIQPDRIREAAAQAVDDGLLQRIAPIIVGPAKLAKDDEPIGKQPDRYRALIRDLYQLRKSPRPTTLRFSAGAQEIFRKVQERTFKLSGIETVHPKLASAILKGDALFCRLALTFHACEHCTDGSLSSEIEASTATRAAILLDYVRGHQAAFFTDLLGMSVDNDVLRNIASLILTRRLTNVSNRDVQQALSSKHRPDSRTISGFMEQMHALGWLLDPVASVRGGAPPVWPVSPKVHEQFGERAKSERERKHAARQAILEMTAKKSTGGWSHGSLAS